jgi:hypothetical protein
MKQVWEYICITMCKETISCRHFTFLVSLASVYTTLSIMETETAVPSEAPIKLTKSGKPRKPFVMTPARKEAFEKCRLARLAKRAEAGTPAPATENVQRAKEQAQRIDDAMGVTPTSVPAAPSRTPRVVVPKKTQPVLKEKKIPQRTTTPKRSALELKGDPHPIVSPDMDTEEDPEEETEDIEPVDMDQEAPNTEEENEDAGGGEVVEDAPVRAVHTPDVNPEFIQYVYHLRF